MPLWSSGGALTLPGTMWKGYVPTVTNQTIGTQTLWNVQKNPFKSNTDAIQK